MFKKVLFLLLTFAIPVCVLAQSSGKIIGMIIDKETGEPLPGVNVVLQDTYLGATTDVDGYFIILNVPVGVYSVEASYVGYTNVIVENLRVSADVTSEQNFQLQPTTLEIGEAIIIVAKKPLVEKHRTYSAAEISREEIENAPVRGLQSFMALMPSVVVQDGAVNIRGGRGEEVGYYLDGSSTMNPLNRTNAVHVIQEAVEEVQVLTGGFSAEYGNANSGIVKTQLRQGTSDFNFSLMAETDKFAEEGGEFLGTHSYRDHIISATASGPITSNIRFFVAGEMESIGDTKKRFSEGYTFEDREDMNPSSPLVKAGSPEKVDITYPDGFTPNNWRDLYTLNGTMSFNFNPYHLRLSGIFSYQNGVSTNNPMRSYLQDRWVEDQWTTGLFSAKFTHIINEKTYYDVNLSYYMKSHDEDDQLLGNDWQKWGDSLYVADATNGSVTYRDRWRPNYNYLINGISFTRPGGYETYNKSKQNYIGATLDFVSQIGKHHELKFGLSGKTYTIRQYSVDPYIMCHFDPNYVDSDGNHLSGNYFKNWDEMLADSTKAYRNYLGNTYGYDAQGNEISGSGFDGPRNPIMAAVYLTDKIEYKDLILNVGLRMDYFDSDDYTLNNIQNAEKDPTTGDVKENEWNKVDAHLNFSPRLGISFPVSERTKFYAQYGKYVQMPEFDDIYYNNYQYGRQLTAAGYFYLDPVGFGFDPIFTTSYEVGFNKQLGDYAALDIAGFYKNIEGQIMANRVTPESNQDLVIYNRKTNGDFSTNKGLELRLTLRRMNRLQGQVNYTFTQAEGTGSGEISYISAVDRGSQVPNVLSPVDFNQTHRGSIILDYRFGDNDGGPILEQSGINLIYSFNSGHPYTHVVNIGGQSGPYDSGVDYMHDTRSRTASEPINASFTPWVNNVDLRIDKSFNIVEDLNATVYLRVTNLFNTKNTINVYQETGSDTDDGFITNDERRAQFYSDYDGQDYLDVYNALNTVNGSSYLSELGLELWDHPRQILLGIKLNY